MNTAENKETPTAEPVMDSTTNSSVNIVESKESVSADPLPASAVNTSVATVAVENKDASLSQCAINFYHNLQNKLQTSNATCTLSLADPKEIKEYFKWIAVPSGQGGDHLYSVDGFREYISSLNGQSIIPDPMRNHANLNFMMTRLNRLIDHLEMIYIL
jgi:hypothetical protein